MVMCSMQQVSCALRSPRLARPHHNRMMICASASQTPTQGPTTCLITGANTGIGLETALATCRAGYATVLACRDKAKAEAAKAAIKAQVPGAKVEVALLDLANLSTVRDFANKALDVGKPLDVLINNAGVMALPNRTETADGFEYQLGVNHLGHFLLTTMLLPLMTDPARPSRIINVASSAHQFGHINFDDLQSVQSYQAWQAYGQSKLANILFTYELARRLGPDANVTANCLHPGIVNTELARYLFDASNIQWWQQPLIAASQLFLKTPQQGAATSIHLATSPEVAGVSGKYWVDCQPRTSNRESYDSEVARRLWDASVELTGAPADALAPVPAR